MLNIFSVRFEVEESNDAIYAELGSIYSEDYQPHWWECVFDYFQEKFCENFEKRA